MSHRSLRFVALLLLASCAAHRTTVATVAVVEPAPPTDLEARALLSVQEGYEIGRRQVELDGSAPREWVFSARTSTERAASIAFVAWRSGRWALLGRAQSSLAEQGTFELDAGYTIERSLAVDQGRELVVTEWIEAQGAVDPRTITRRLEVFALRDGAIERVLSCPLGLTVVTGPDREEQPSVQWSFVAQESTASAASIELTDDRRRASLRYARGQWVGIDELACDVSRTRL